MLSQSHLIVALALALFPAARADFTPLDHGYRQMYNLQFDAAHHSFQNWERVHPDDPLGPVSDAAAYLFSEFDRLHILQSEFFLDNNSIFQFRRPNADPSVKKKF